jgi:hypothetical protein
MKTYMVTFRKSGYDRYTRFDEFDNAINFAEHMAKRHNSNVEVRNYDTEELIYAVDAKTDLDNKLRI